MQFNPAIAKLAPGDHLCCMYRTEEDHRAVLTPFVHSGLEQGQKVLYVVDARTAETVFGYLDRQGMPTAGYISSGQLVVAESRDTYLQGGKFDPDKMIALLRRETDKALQEGYAALRVTGEMSWALRGLPGTERLMEYEAKLNQFFPANSAIGLCQYDMRHFASQVLLDVLATHPIAIVGDKCYDNIYYIPPDEFLGPDRADAELERRLQNLEDRQQSEEALRQSEARARHEAAFSNAVLDTAGALIVVVDLEGKIRRFNRTCEKLTGYSAIEVLGRNLWDLFISKEEAEQTFAVFEQLKCGQFPNRLENEWLTKDGARLRVDWSNTCLQNEASQVELIVSIGLDVTEASLAKQAREREFSSLEKYSDAEETSTTASSLGIQALSSTQAEAFQDLVAEFEEYLEQAVQQSVYKIKLGLTEKLKFMAARLGKLQAGPRDVVQAYIQAIQEKTRHLESKMARAYTDEGRLLLIELMGYLVAYYRTQSLGKGENLPGL